MFTEEVSKFRPTPAQATGIASNIEMALWMELIREIEEKLVEAFKRGQVPGTLHTALGQEASAVALARSLNSTSDWLFSTHPVSRDRWYPLPMALPIT